MVLDFENDNVFVEFEPEEGISEKEYKINVYATNTNDGGSPVKVFTSKTEPLKITKGLVYRRK